MYNFLKVDSNLILLQVKKSVEHHKFQSRVYRVGKIRDHSFVFKGEEYKGDVIVEQKGLINTFKLSFMGTGRVTITDFKEVLLRTERYTRNYE